MTSPLLVTVRWDRHPDNRTAKAEASMHLAKIPVFMKLVFPMTKQNRIHGDKIISAVSHAARVCGIPGHLELAPVRGTAYPLGRILYNHDHEYENHRHPCLRKLRLLE